MASTDVVVLGGGFAGLACATALVEKGARVAVLEKKPHLGGRAFSFKDPKTGEIVDNGQHLFMGCYRQTRIFLRRIGSESLLRLPAGLRVDYVDENGLRDKLECPTFLPAPLHLAAGIFRLSGLSMRDKLGLWGFQRWMKKNALNGSRPTELDAITVREWMGRLGISERMQRRLFDPIAIGALNEHSERASALGFTQVLREIFFTDEESSRLGLATVGLSELYTEQSRRLIESKGGRVLTGKKVARIVEEGGRAVAVETDLGERIAAEAVVSTLPPWALAAVERPSALHGDWEKLKATPIVGIHVWLDRPIFSEPFIGLLGTELHWAFNKNALWGRNGGGQYLSLVISGAHRYLEVTPQKIWEQAQWELSRCFPAFEEAKVLNWSVVKEPHATPAPLLGTDALRPAHASKVSNFFFGGDWTQTGLPATIESAVSSGHACAELASKI